jgi:hypothetical protein
MPDTPSSSERLRNLMNAIADEEATLSDETILAEARERGEDPEERSAALRALLQEATLDADRPAAVGKTDESEAPPKHEYSMEVELRKHASKTEDERNESVGLSVVFRRRSNDRTPDASGSRWTPGTWTAVAAGFTAVCAIGLIFVFALRERQEPPRDIAQNPPLNPPPPVENAAPSNTSPPPPQNTNGSGNANRSTPKHPPKPNLRSGNTSLPEVPLSRIRTVFVDLQETPLGGEARAEFVSGLRASGRLSVVEDREAADARLRFDLSKRGWLTAQLISGSRVVWSAAEPVREATPSAAGDAARRLVERLLRVPTR